MEEILKEILYELKEIKKEIRVIEGNSNLKPVDIKITIDEDVILEKVIDSINDKGRMSRNARIAI